MEERGIAQGVWPQCKVNCLWPASVGMQQLLVRALREIADRALGNAILEVGVHPTKGEFLPCIVAYFLESVVVKLPVVAVVVHDFDSVLGHIQFERELGSKRFG